MQKIIKNVNVRRRADVGSDHELVANIQLKLCRQSVEKGGRKRYDVDKLRVYETAQEFRIALSNRFQVLEQTERVDEEVLGFRRHAQPRWMTGRSPWIQNARTTRMDDRKKPGKSKRAESNQGQNQCYQVGKTKDNTKEQV